jgi:hypothetical protein
MRSLDGAPAGAEQYYLRSTVVFITAKSDGARCASSRIARPRQIGYEAHHAAWSDTTWQGLQRSRIGISVAYARHCSFHPQGNLGDLIRV